MQIKLAVNAHPTHNIHFQIEQRTQALPLRYVRKRKEIVAHFATVQILFSQILSQEMNYRLSIAINSRKQKFNSD